jgi:hypothetical protein
MLPSVLGVRGGTPQHSRVQRFNGGKYDISAQRVAYFVEQLRAVFRFGCWRERDGAHELAFRADATVRRALISVSPAAIAAVISSSSIWLISPSSTAQRAAQ